MIKNYSPGDVIDNITYTNEFLQTDGSIVSHSTCFLSNYIDVEPGIYYVSGVLSGSNMIVAGFNENEEFISVILQINNGEAYTDKSFFLSGKIKKIRIQSLNSEPTLKKAKLITSVITSQLYYIGDNILSRSTYTKEWVNAVGTVSSNSSVNLSGFVDVNSGDTLYATGQMSGSNPVVIGYNSDKSFVSVLVRTNNGAMLTDQEFSVPNGISYIRAQSLSSYPRVKKRKTINDKIDEFPNYCTPQINQWPIREKDTSEGVRIMCFGSSFFMNTWWYLPYLLKEAGIDAEMSCFYTGGASFDQWIDRYENNTAVDCWTSSNGSDFVKTSKNFRDTLEEGWDVVGFQQGVYQSRDWYSFANWSTLVSYIRRSCDYKTFIAFNCLWPPAIQGNLSPYEGSAEGQRLWQIEANDNFKKFLALSGLSNGAVPNGQTIWALRKNELTKDEDEDLAYGGLHINNGLPMYATAATWFETIISPMFNVSIDNINWMPTENTPKCVVSPHYTSISVEQRNLIRKIIKLSLSNRFGINEI